MAHRRARGRIFQRLSEFQCIVSMVSAGNIFEDTQNVYAVSNVLERREIPVHRMI